MLTEQPFLSVVIPVYEGEGVIRGTIDAVQEHAARRGWSIEVVVGFNRGRDRTRDLLDEACSDYENVIVVDTTEHHGKGGAVRGAMARARGRVRCFIDADNGASFDQIDAALALIDEFDIAVGSRYMPGGSAGKRPFARVVLSRGGNLLIRLVLGVRFTDTRAPLKVYRGPVADHLFRLLRLEGFGFDSELLFLARKLGYTTVEFPIAWTSGERTTVKVPRVAVQSLFELVAVRWHWWTGAYRRERLPELSGAKLERSP